MDARHLAFEDRFIQLRRQNRMGNDSDLGKQRLAAGAFARQHQRERRLI
jgi:hypothetical protein